MNDILRQQLLKTKNVAFYNESGKQIIKEELNDQTTLIVKQKDFSSKTEDLLLFTFEDYLVHPFSGFDFHQKFNNGINIPLTVMQGRVLRTVGKMYYIDVRGFYMNTKRCVHCLKEEDCNPICKDCFKAFNVNDIEEVTWKGYVPIKSIKEMVNI